MYYLMEQLARQREHEIASRTHAPLFTDGRGRSSWMWSRPEESRRNVPSLLEKWRSRRAKPEVDCSRAAAWAGGC